MALLVPRIQAKENIQKLESLKYIFDEPYPLEKWQRLVERIYNKHHQYPIIMVDCLQKIKTDASFDETISYINYLMAGLKKLGKDYRIPVVVIFQIEMSLYKSGAYLPSMSLEDYGSIKEEASWLSVLAILKWDQSIRSLTIRENWETECSGNDFDIVCLKANRGLGGICRIPVSISDTDMTVRIRSF